MDEAKILPNGIMALPGGNFYDPTTNRVFTTSQMANILNLPNAGMFTTPSAPAPSPTPTYGMDENGNIGPVGPDSPSVKQAYDAWDMYNRQLAASGSVNGLPAPTIVSQPPAVPNLPTQPQQSPTGPSMGQEDLIQYIMGLIPSGSLPPVQLIRNEVNNPSFTNPTNTQIGAPSSGMLTGSPQPTQVQPTQVQPTTPTPMAPINNYVDRVADTSAWKAAPSFRTPNQLAGKGMFS